jgi:hypothetical protein
VVSAAPPPPHLSGGDEVHSAGSESTASIRGNGEAVPDGSWCCSKRWSSGTADVRANGGGGVVDFRV